MATILHADKLSEVIHQADIVVLERSDVGSFHTSSVTEEDHLRSLFSSSRIGKLFTSIEGRMLNIGDDRRVAIFCCKRYATNQGPLFKFIPKLVSVLTGSEATLTFGLDLLHIDTPSTYGGVLVLCASLDASQEELITKMFSDWDGTLYLINTFH